MKHLLKLLPILAICVGLSSCSDVLSRTESTTSISQQKGLNSPDAIRALRTGMFAYFHSIPWSTSYMLCPEGRGDDLFSRQGTNRLSGCTHNSKGASSYSWTSFNNDDTPDTDGADGGSGGSYNIIDQANLLIHAIPDGVLPADQKKQYVGEALFVRAFVYHQLVRSLGYEPGMQPAHGTGVGWKLGVPIITKPTLSTADAKYHPRKTVLQVYQLIISDLKKAIKDLSGNSAGNPYYPSKAAAEAELARVYLYAAGDQQNFPQAYQNANKYAKDAIADAQAEVGAAVVPPKGVATMFNEQAGVNPGGIWVIKFTTLTTLGLNNALSAYTVKGWLADVPTQSLIDLYSKNDKRLAWFAPCYDEYNGNPVTNCPATSPYIAAAHGTKGLELDKWMGDAGDFADDVPLLRVAEQLLIETEARLHGAPGDPLKPINTLRTNRGLAPLTSVTMKDVLQSRRREFVGEGMRFWDLKRLGKDITKDPASLNVSDLPYENFKILANLPSSAVKQSAVNAPADSVLIQNPCFDGYTGDAPCP